MSTAFFVLNINQGTKLNKIFCDGRIISKTCIMKSGVSVFINKINISLVPQKLEFEFKVK